MKVVITGGAGFLGTLLARRLLQAPVSIGGAEAREVSELILLDLFPPADDLAADSRVRAATGEVEQLLPTVGSADLIFHLAGVVSSAAEADFDLGMRTNVDGLLAVLEWCRAQSVPPVLVFSSSLAVYGADPAVGPVGDVNDDTLPRPQSSYGIQKFIGEQLVADYTRKGFVRGRTVRLMTVSVRPGKPNAAASSFLSGIIREPLAGMSAVCPVPPETPIALSSPRRTIDGIVRAAQTDDGEWGSRTAMNLPALTTSPREMAAALDRVTGEGTSDLIEWTHDSEIEAIVGSWPARFDTARAASLGLVAETSFEDIIRQYIEDNRITTS